MSENSHDTTGHSGKRTDCHLCLKPNAKMKHLHQLQSQFKETYAWLKEHKAELDNAACLCLPCVKQIQRNHHREFTPRWLAKPPVPPKLCNVQHCQGTVHAQTSLMSAAALETCLNSLGPIAHICAHLFRTFGARSAYTRGMSHLFFPSLYLSLRV